MKTRSVPLFKTPLLPTKKRTLEDNDEATPSKRLQTPLIPPNPPTTIEFSWFKAGQDRINIDPNVSLQETSSSQTNSTPKSISTALHENSWTKDIVVGSIAFISGIIAAFTAMKGGEITAEMLGVDESILGDVLNYIGALDGGVLHFCFILSGGLEARIPEDILGKFFIILAALSSTNQIKAGQNAFDFLKDKGWSLPNFAKDFMGLFQTVAKTLTTLGIAGKIQTTFQKFNQKYTEGTVGEKLVIVLAMLIVAYYAICGVDSACSGNETLFSYFVPEGSSATEISSYILAIVAQLVNWLRGLSNCYDGITNFIDWICARGAPRNNYVILALGFSLTAVNSTLGTIAATTPGPMLGQFIPLQAMNLAKLISSILNNLPGQNGYVAVQLKDFVELLNSFVEFLKGLYEKLKIMYTPEKQEESSGLKDKSNMSDAATLMEDIESEKESEKSENLDENDEDLQSKTSEYEVPTNINLRRLPIRTDIDLNAFT